MKNEIAIIGLGKMGGNMSRRLRAKGWRIVGIDKGDDFSLIVEISKPRVVLLSLPSAVVDSALGEFGGYLERGDIIIDAGNSFYKDTLQRAKKLSKKGIEFVDVGVSGGPEGALRGSSLMVGGKKKTFEYLKELLDDLAIRDGVQFFEGNGAGHFVKMVHNGIEYGMMQSLAEGFSILKKSKYKLDLDRVADIYNHGSVIESRLVSWVIGAIKTHGKDFKNVSGKVGHTGEGEWTIKTAKEFGITAKVLEESFNFRKKSQKNPSWIGKFLTALRAEFGGHEIK